MSMDQEDIRAYYESIGMEYNAEDWGARAENGESASHQANDPERPGEHWVQTMDPQVMHGFEGDEGGVLKPAWHPRDAVDRAMVQAVEDFFRAYAPGFDLLPALAALLYEPERSLSDVADEQGVSKQAVSQARQRAIRRVERSISRAWRDPEGDDSARAWAVFVGYWRERFGAEFPETNGPAGTEFVGA